MIKFIIAMAKTINKAISAITGRFVSMEYAKNNPETTVVMKVRVGRIKHRK